VEDRLPFESELIARIGWLIRLRWVAVAGATLAIGLAALWFAGELALLPLVGTTAAIACYNLAFLRYLPGLRRDPSRAVRLRRATHFAYIQIILDLFALAILVRFTGGVQSPLILFFVFHVIIASILLRPGLSYLVAGLAVLLVGCIAGLEYVGVFRHYQPPSFEAELYRESFYLLVSVAGMALTLVLVAYLTTSIMVRLRERDRLLLESNQLCQWRSRELEDLNEKLRQVDVERTRFMVLVTHELRAPLSTIYSALELALSGYASPEKTHDVLERAQNRASELLDLISDLLDLTKVREQTVRPKDVTPLQLEDVLREVVAFMRIEAEGKGLSLEMNVSPNLAPVRARPDQIKLVWTNLLSNAVKYSEPGGKVYVSLSQDTAQVIGAVRDTGIGIAPKDVDRVFDEFYRAGNARKVSPHGTGVGLAIVRRTIEYWGGRVWVESDLGRGSKFVFVLPRADI
jgi:signal transduction histidine kinase